METAKKSPAKVNFLLKITGRRMDGYHEIRSVIQMIDLADTLTFRPREDGVIKLICDHPDVPTDGRNLVMKAAEQLRRRAGIRLGADIMLEKRIPVAAGLGGGSSNAACALAALNELWGAGLSRGALMEAGLAVGADVPFFLGESALAWVEGIGEKVAQMRPAKSLPLLLLNPGFGISAGEAYRGFGGGFSPFPRDPGLAADMESAEPERVARSLSNDLEGWAMRTHVGLAALKKAVESASPEPLGVLMSGSGPTLLAIYRDAEETAEAKAALGNAAPFVAAAETLVENPA
ncbi:MAG: 4-(cytidine 5'-diphospho)-2-C-methyl-D-erythritol kinase [Candidatus Nitrospinota bacterium M3_3B_026]